VRSKRLPVLPGLEAGAVEEEMEGLPVAEDLVTVMNQVGGRAHVAEEPERQKREEPFDALLVGAGGPPAVLGVLGVPFVGLRRRRDGTALARRRERHGRRTLARRAFRFWIFGFALAAPRKCRITYRSLSEGLVWMLPLSQDACWGRAVGADSEPRQLSPKY
jgi:hypothetical protein